VAAQLNVAKAAEQSQLAMDPEIGGVIRQSRNQAQLDDASWQLSQTTIRAPADGYVPIVALTVGDRALQASAVMSFVVDNEITFSDVFAKWLPDDQDRNSSRYRFR
jgi:multidrug resistance efflux pump